MAQLRVTVAVLTYQRPDELARLLPALLEQASASPHEVDVLVVDNDPGQSGLEVVDRSGNTGVRCLWEPVPGIAAARNRALTESGDRDLLVFIDDDEVPSPDWLSILVATYESYGPAVVVGRVVSEFEGDLDEWVVAGQFFVRPHGRRTGDKMAAAATNNMLIDMSVIRATGLEFDLSFGISGGSDTLFTRQLTKAGYEIIWCHDGYVVDRVPQSRMSANWALNRAFRSGNSWGRTSLVLADTPGGRTRARITLVGSGSLRFSAGSARSAWGRVFGSMVHDAKGQRTRARGAGLLLAARGGVFEEYRRD